MRNISDEGIKNPKRYERKPEITKEYIQSAINYVLKKIDENLEVFSHKFPAPSSEGNVYAATENYEWTPGFWTGMLWLAYEVTGDEKYRKVAQGQLESYRIRLEQRICTETHDLGFLYSLSCVAAYKLTGNERAKETALMAAKMLSERYFDKAGIIQAWGNLENPKQRGRMIIDCCLNLPLLYWASEVTGDKHYFEIANSHIGQATKYLIRDDSSTYHTYYMDVETGEPRFGKTQQGFSDDSCWSRGQAWAIYGLPLNYNYTKDFELIEICKKVTHYYLNRLPEDYVCYWDLIFIEGDEERDSSAAAIAVCGILEMLKHLQLTTENDSEGTSTLGLMYDKSIYENSALGIVKSLIDNYTSKDCPHSNGLLLHGVYGKPLNHGVDECCLWGDYFYFEALVRLIKDWKLYW